jgi:hypothetical protein
MRYLLLSFVLYIYIAAWLNDIGRLPLYLVALTLSLFAFYGLCMLYDKHGRPR